MRPLFKVRFKLDIYPILDEWARSESQNRDGNDDDDLDVDLDLDLDVDVDAGTVVGEVSGV